jgi:hypothetical protein
MKVLRMFSPDPRIRMFLGLPYPRPDPLVKYGSGSGPGSFHHPHHPAKIVKIILITVVFSLLYDFLLMFRMFPDPHPDPLDRGTNTRIWIRTRIRTKMSRIHNTGYVAFNFQCCTKVPCLPNCREVGRMIEKRIRRWVAGRRSRHSKPFQTLREY